MGGPIAQLMARDHPDTVSTLVCCATATDWSKPRMKLLWRSMGLLRLGLNAFPIASWRSALRAGGFPDNPTTTWIAAELSRGSGRDLAEAGRELGRFDSRGWVGRLRTPAAVVVTAGDRSVPPHKQRELASLLRAPQFEDPGDHDAVVTHGARFAAVLQRAIASTSAPDRERNSATAP